MILTPEDIGYFKDCVHHALSSSVVNWYIDNPYVSFTRYLKFVSEVSLSIGQLNIDSLPDTTESHDFFRSACDGYLVL